MNKHLLNQHNLVAEVMARGLSKNNNNSNTILKYFHHGGVTPKYLTITSTMGALPQNT